MNINKPKQTTYWIVEVDADTTLYGKTEPTQVTTGKYEDFWTTLDEIEWKGKLAGYYGIVVDEEAATNI